MKKILLTTFLLVLCANIFAQDCASFTISEKLQKSNEKDSIYKIDLDSRIAYYLKLSKEILPRYLELKKSIKLSLNRNDKGNVKALINSYEENRYSYLKEFKNTQARLYQNINGYSNLNTLLIFETFSIFPDSYAILLNKNFPNNRVKEKDVALINKLHSEYQNINFENSNCIDKLKIEMTKAKKEFNVVEIFQNSGNKTNEEIQKSELMNLIIWANK